MCILKQHSMSAYEIIGAIAKKFGIKIGPSTVYFKLYTLEEQGQIHCVEGRSGKVYSLTEQGQQTINDTPITIEEIYDSAQTLLTSQTNTYKKKTDTLTL
ncbi:MAG: PadR family transcriptional regulator [Candidatus Bathyarchaeota archaeon]|nr:PadR family transcriptional regulator [Candidatus Bathyarchaeota archaeon]